MNSIFLYVFITPVQALQKLGMKRKEVPIFYILIRSRQRIHSSFFFLVAIPPAFVS